MAEFKQDMPPPGGYAPVGYSRVPMKPGLSHVTKYALCLGFCTAAFLLYKQNKSRFVNEKIEMRCSRFAIRPLIEAESDRLFLKQIRKHRDYEEKLMKDVPGWEVGKFENYPVYLTLKPDEFYIPSAEEFFAHSDPKIHKKYTPVLSKV